MLTSIGMSEEQIRAYLEREIGAKASTSTFYWDSEELEEAVDMLVDAISKVVAANNAAILSGLKREAQQARLGL
jgi:hypothetical protein